MLFLLVIADFLHFYLRTILQLFLHKKRSINYRIGAIIRILFSGLRLGCINHLTTDSFVLIILFRHITFLFLFLGWIQLSLICYKVVGTETLRDIAILLAFILFKIVQIDSTLCKRWMVVCITGRSASTNELLRGWRVTGLVDFGELWRECGGC